MHKKLFTDTECSEIIRFSEKQNKWVNNSHYQLFIFKPDQFISDKIIKYGKEKLGLSILNVNLGIVKYLVGDSYPRHIDRHTEIEFNKDFLYNINLKLNDDFEGGDFFLNDELFVAAVGDVYHYKSTQYHEVKPITRGIRYTGLFYIRERDLGISKLI
jgi:hypothetical protein